MIQFQQLYYTGTNNISSCLVEYIAVKLGTSNTVILPLIKQGSECSLAILCLPSFELFNTFPILGNIQAELYCDAHFPLIHFEKINQLLQNVGKKEQQRFLWTKVKEVKISFPRYNIVADKLRYPLRVTLNRRYKQWHAIEKIHFSNRLLNQFTLPFIRRKNVLRSNIKFGLPFQLAIIQIVIPNPLLQGLWLLWGLGIVHVFGYYGQKLPTTLAASLTQ